MLGRLSLFFNQSGYIVTPTLRIEEKPAEVKRAEEKQNKLNDLPRHTLFYQGMFTSLGLRAFCSLDLTGMLGWGGLFYFSAQIAEFSYDHKIHLLANALKNDIITYVQNKAAIITPPSTEPITPRGPKR
jgi:hypothetical protein